MGTDKNLTVEITRIHTHGDGEDVALDVTLSDGVHTEKQSLRISAEQYAALRPVRGKITEAQFDAFSAAAGLTEAVKKGSAILAFGANSQRALVQKLRARGIAEETAAQAAKYLAEHHCMNESSDARREAERDAAKLWGKRRILAHLRSRGYEDETLSSLDGFLDGIDFVTNAERLLASHLRGATDPTSKKKAVASLVRYGYTMDEIKAAYANLTQKK